VVETAVEQVECLAGGTDDFLAAMTMICAIIIVVVELTGGADGAPRSLSNGNDAVGGEFLCTWMRSACR
jgi:hypothetical protein